MSEMPSAILNDITRIISSPSNHKTSFHHLLQNNNASFSYWKSHEFIFTISSNNWSIDTSPYCRLCSVNLGHAFWNSAFTNMSLYSLGHSSFYSKRRGSSFSLNLKGVTYHLAAATNIGRDISLCLYSLQPIRTFGMKTICSDDGYSTGEILAYAKPKYWS